MTTLPASPQPSTKAPPNRCFSYWQRRIACHLTLALTALACSGLFWHLFSARRDLISHLSIATAYPALFLTAAALFLGPWNVLRLRANPVSFDLRRDVGIWAGAMALLHTAIGLNVHLRGRPWLYFVDQDHHVRHDLFGFCNDLSLRRLGTQKWKSLQRWTYAVVVLTILHTVAYQHIEKRQAAYGAMLWCRTVALACFQISGWWITKRRYS